MDPSSPDQWADLRAAGESDTQALATLARDTFRETFAKDNDPADLAEYLDQAFAPAQIARELRDPANTFLLAFQEEVSKSPVGYAKLRAGTRHRFLNGTRPIELERIYVVQSAIGHGLGAALMRACLERTAESKNDSLWLGVWERNQRAIDFYRSWGFQTVGKQQFQLGSDLQTDLVMERLIES